MATVGQQARVWGVALVATLIVVWLLADVLLPFAVGGALAYMLDPLADRLERAGVRRGWAVAIIVFGAVLAFALVVALLVPILVDQANRLIETAPTLITNATDWLLARFPALSDDSSELRQQAANVFAAIQARFGTVLNTVLTSAMGLVNVVLLVVIVPVVTFYLLLDWDRAVSTIDDLLPREHAPTIRRLGREIDGALASFIRGQALVCLILGTWYAVALMAVGLSFGLVIGAIAGALTFIPYVGALVGGILAIGFALYQFWGEWWWVLAVWAIFQSGQFVEGNFLTPKLVGESVGVHPVWLLLALAAFGALFGFLGLLVAVPVAAIIGVLVRHFLRVYKSSRLYQGPVVIPVDGPVDGPVGGRFDDPLDPGTDV